jgi:signal transduction histidine kinase
VWTNLLNNACDALDEMHRDGMGHIEVVTCQEVDCVVVRISDDGPAIPEHVMPRIFDPFFTTKPVGKGTGLGLGICRGILQRCNGRIEAINAPGWVTFKVSLPLTYATNGGETPAPKATDASPDAGPAA